MSFSHKQQLWLEQQCRDRLGWTQEMVARSNHHDMTKALRTQQCNSETRSLPSSTRPTTPITGNSSQPSSTVVSQSTHHTRENGVVSSPDTMYSNNVGIVNSTHHIQSTVTTLVTNFTRLQQRLHAKQGFIESNKTADNLLSEEDNAILIRSINSDQEEKSKLKLQILQLQSRLSDAITRKHTLRALLGGGSENAYSQQQDDMDLVKEQINMLSTAKTQLDGVISLDTATDDV